MCSVSVVRHTHQTLVRRVPWRNCQRDLLGYNPRAQAARSLISVDSQPDRRLQSSRARSVPKGDELLDDCTTGDERPLGNLLTAAIAPFAQLFPQAAARIVALADDGWLENHQTAGSVNQVGQELLGTLQGDPTTDAD